MDMLGWLLILITISPLQSYPKYSKTIRYVFFVHQLITNTLNTVVRIKYKQRFKCHLIEMVIVKIG